MNTQGWNNYWMRMDRWKIYLGKLYKLDNRYTEPDPEGRYKQFYYIVPVREIEGIVEYVSVYTGQYDAINKHSMYRYKLAGEEWVG